MTNRPVLIVESDHTLREHLSDHLAGLFSPVEASTVIEAKRLLDVPDARFDAILVGLSLADGDGREFAAQARGDRLHMPIIVIGTSDETAVVGALNAGANDYIGLPVRIGELVARISAQLRSYDSTDHAAISLGRFVFRPAAKTLTGPNKRRIYLTAKEVAIIRYMHNRNGEIILRQKLLDDVWGYNPEVTTHTLETHIYRLRQKIEPETSKCSILVTVPGGYRFNPDDAQLDAVA